MPLTPFEKSKPIRRIHTSHKPLISSPTSLKKADIIGQVVDDFQPKCFVAPFYGKKQKSVAYGNKFKQSKTKHKPTVQIYCPNMKSTPGLTLALTDPDAPSRDNPKWGEMCHVRDVFHFVFGLRDCLTEIENMKILEFYDFIAGVVAVVYNVHVGLGHQSFMNDKGYNGHCSRRVKFLIYEHSRLTRLVDHYCLRKRNLDTRRCRIGNRTRPYRLRRSHRL
jgi:hypothetical protein